MAGDSRTLLTEYVDANPRVEGLEKISYTVFRFIGNGGFAARTIRAVGLDEHYIIVDEVSGNSRNFQNLGVIDVNAGDIDKIRMHDLAVGVAGKWAAYDGNSVLDLTSMCTDEISGEDGHYILIEEFSKVRNRIKAERINYWDAASEIRAPFRPVK